MSSELLEGSSAWTIADCKPCARLLVVLLEDVYGVRDLVARYEARGRKLPPGLRGQYAHDQQWIKGTEEQSPFSFAWVCQQLDLEAETVRASYFGSVAKFRWRRAKSSLYMTYAAKA